MRLRYSGLVIYIVVLMTLVWTPVKESDGLFLGLFSVGPMLEKFLNVWLLMPLPILMALALVKSSWRGMWVLGTGVSGVIEVVQMWIPGRVPDLMDVVLNTGGYLVGLWLVKRGVVSRFF